MKFDDEMKHSAGYTLLNRGGRIEIWHFYSDVLKHVSDDWLSGVEWAYAHSTIPRIPNKPWPYGYHDV
jgi:hypothetical protein